MAAGERFRRRTAASLLEFAVVGWVVAIYSGFIFALLLAARNRADANPGGAWELHFLSGVSAWVLLPAAAVLGAAALVAVLTVSTLVAHVRVRKILRDFRKDMRVAVVSAENVRRRDELTRKWSEQVQRRTTLLGRWDDLLAVSAGQLEPEELTRHQQSRSDVLNGLAEAKKRLQESKGRQAAVHENHDRIRKTLDEIHSLAEEEIRDIGTSRLGEERTEEYIEQLQALRSEHGV